jgi:four helix bundle protein
MTRDEMKARTKAYANRIVKLCSALPINWIARTLGMQLLRAGTSVGANYRAVCRAKSKSDFINKLRIVEEECDESLFWMELLADNQLIKPIGWRLSCRRPVKSLQLLSQPRSQPECPQIELTQTPPKTNLDA